MLNLSSPTQFQTPPQTPQALKRPDTPISHNKFIIAKQATKNHTNHEPSVADSPNTDLRKSRDQPIRRPPQPRKTNPIIWCAAIFCMIFSLLLIFFGIATLIIFLVVRPKSPLFDTPYASLNVIYFDSPEYFNGDFSFLANFSNPNRKLDVRFEYLNIELYFDDRLISTLALQPFTQRPGENRVEPVRMISSLVYLPQNHAVELRTQVQSNRINYNIRGTFKVRASIGMIHISYWLHSRCQLQMTGPPTGFLVGRSSILKDLHSINFIWSVCHYG